MTRLVAVLRWLAWWGASAVRTHMSPSPALRAVAHPSAPQSLADLNSRSTRAHMEGR